MGLRPVLPLGWFIGLRSFWKSLFQPEGRVCILKAQQLSLIVEAGRGGGGVGCVLCVEHSVEPALRK